MSYFDFKVTRDSVYNITTTIDYRLNDGTATIADNDYNASSNTLVFAPNELEKTVRVEVIGDIKVEPNETFSLDLFNPQLLNITDAQGLGTIINDDSPTLNIERTNSDTVDNATEERRKALYTQISGRDFDYAIVSTNEDSAFDVSDVTVKVELFDNNSSKINDVIRTAYLYTNESDNRFKILDDNDLKIERATRNASFRLSFLLDENGTMLHGNYANEVDYNMTKAMEGNSEKISGSDNFAIRPNTYTINVKDKDENNNSVTYDTSTLLNLVAEHNYKVEVNATRYNSKERALQYRQALTSQLDSQLIFDDSSLCNDDANRSLNYKFNDGTVQKAFNHNNYGKYKIKIVDSNWTEIDQENGDCILDDSTVSNDGNSQSGCNIESEDVALKFMPYEFDMSATTLKNIHNDKDYLYMNDLNRSINMGIKLSSIINAVGENNTTLSNFTKSCMSSDIRLQLGLKFSFISDEGESNNSNYTPPKSIATIGGGRTTLMPQQVVYFNDDNTTNVEHMRDINIEEAFLDENNGSMKITTLYNMEKLFKKPTNPIKVDFISLDINSSNLSAKLRDKEHDANGTGEILENRIFYFARVASYRENYPETNKKHFDTPLFIEIFCKKPNDPQWCNDVMNLNNVTLQKGIRKIRGWHTTKNHDSLAEGQVYRLISNKDSITTNYPDNNCTAFITGRIDDIQTSSTSTEERIKAIIAIDSDVWLRYNKKVISGVPFGSSSYSVIIKNPSALTGIGENKTMIESANKVEHNGKMSW